MSVRFAPSPTGTFHLGNLRTAWVSHAFARHLKMQWVVRFEDIDYPRVVYGAQEKQLADMKTLGLVPDQILTQRKQQARHEALFRDAVAQNQVYACTCSRKEILQDLQAIASAPHGEPLIYNGRCRSRTGEPKTKHPEFAWRYRNPEDESGRHDFIIARTDSKGSHFVPSYHWACAIDDYDGDHALLVRASDLSHVTPLQRQVHRWVGEHEKRPRAYPAVFHAALVKNTDGTRLEKRTKGVTLDEALSNGSAPEMIWNAFKASFDPKLFAQFSPGKIWGETPDETIVSAFLPIK